MNDYSIFSTVENIVKIDYQIESKDILGFYIYGSKVYGTSTVKSDTDFMVIFKDSKSKFYHYKSDDVNIQIISDIKFDEMLYDHDIIAMEVYFDKSPIIKHCANFVIDTKRLRRSISQKSSNSFVKAYKKISIEEENSYIGIKSLFHSLRILNFGIQIGKCGRIEDYSSANKYWDEILSMLETNTLLEIHEHFKPEFKRLKKQFKISYNELKQLK